MSIKTSKLTLSIKDIPEVVNKLKEADARIAELENENVTLLNRVTLLRTLIKSAIPIIEEGWIAAFRGKEQALLSSEERGLGSVLEAFRAATEGEDVKPFGYVTYEECEKRTKTTTDWAYRTLGTPNELAPHLQQWMKPGETCVEGIQRANAEVERCQTKIAELEDSLHTAKSQLAWFTDPDNRDCDDDVEVTE